MSVGLDEERRRRGTRFRLFPQAPWLAAFSEPETVWVSTPAGSVLPGPADGRMYVVDALGKRRSYGVKQGPSGDEFLYLPPWDGPVQPPAMPDAEGHFDHLEPGTDAFEAAHLYASVRFVLDIWEDYLGHRVDWHFARDYDRLELLLLPRWDNAQTGYGFMEVGYQSTDDGRVLPYALNFDIVAHEAGHAIVYSQIGVPDPDTAEAEYFGFHEAAADLTSLVSVLHFDSVVDHLLANTRGNLYTLNKLNRIGEYSESEQIRVAANTWKLSDFEDGWSDEHDLSRPLTGALFDLLVDVFHEGLVARSLISPEVEDLADRVEKHPGHDALIQALFDDAYGRCPEGFADALLEARDVMGLLLANTWRRLSPHSLNYDDVRDALIAADRQVTGGRYARIIRVDSDWRDIGRARVGPRVGRPRRPSHARSNRTVTPRSAPMPRPGVRPPRAPGGRRKPRPDRAVAR